MPTSVAEAQEVLSRPKVLASDMLWPLRRGKLEFGWVEAKLLVQFSDEMVVAEDFVVSCQWRKQGRKIPEHWCFSVLYQGDRIYAIDVQPEGKHMNSAGKGRPFYKQWINGVHEHFWTDEGYGYAEPIDVPLGQPEIVWRIFLSRANIFLADFFHPDENEPELEL